MSKIALAYLALLTLHIGGLLQSYSLVSTLTKPLLVPCLIVLVWLDGREFRKNVFILTALAFSWLGDVFLMLPGEIYFIWGLLAFLSAHACYIWVFSRQSSFLPIRILPFLAYVALLMSGPLRGKLPEGLRIPIYLYIAVLTGMGCMAALRRSREPGYELLLIGAILFILSDSFLALNKFASPIPLGGFWIMLTYGLAQYFIVRGYLAGHTSKS